MNRITINPKIDLHFSLKVREMCRSCKRYGKKATCPPYVNSVEHYKRLLKSFSIGEVYYCSFKADPSRWKEVGRHTSLEIHKAIADRRRELQDRGHIFVVAFGAGSCKLCSKCSIPCRHPEQSLVPLEGSGINVVRLMKKKANINISFPIRDKFYRVGAVFYDK